MYNGNNIDDQFKKKFDSFTPAPSAEVWEKVRSQIPAPAPTPFFKLPIFWGFSSAAILLLAGLTYFFQNYELQIVAKDASSLTALSNSQENTNKDATTLAYQSTAKEALVNNESEVVQNQIKDYSNSAKQAVIASSTQKADHSVLKESADAPSQGTLASIHSYYNETAGGLQRPIHTSSNASKDNAHEIWASSNTNATPTSKNNGEIILANQATINPLSLLKSGTIAKIQLDNDIPLPTDVPVKHKDAFNSVKGLHFGLAYAVNNTWLLNKKITNQTAAGDINYRLDFGPAFGFTLGYDFSPKWGVQLDWIVNSHQGQKFANEYGNQIALKENNLKYTHIPLLLKYKQCQRSKLTRNIFALNYVFGIQYSRLKAAEINLDYGFAEDLLQKHEWGLVLGLDYDLYIHKNFIINVGTRSSLELGDNPSTFFSEERARNFLLGVHAGLKYKFRQ